jgi:membrane-associated PAP2 superfamily phosphatase
MQGLRQLGCGDKEEVSRMWLLVLSLVATFVIVAMFLVELGLFPWLAILVAIPIAYGVGFAISRLLRGAGAL